MSDDSRGTVDAGTGLSFGIVAGNDIEEREREQIIGLLDRAFGGWPGFDLSVPPIEHLQWKLEGPPGQPSTVVLVRDGTRIVALTNSVEFRFLAMGDERRARLGADTAVDPEYQGRGIDSARRAYQVERLEPHFDLSLSYSINPAIIHGDLKYGAVTFGNPLRLLFKVVDARRAAAAFQERRRPRLPAAVWIAASTGIDLWTGLRHGRSLTGQQDWSLTTIECFDDRMDAFARDAAWPFDFVHLRDHDYLNWRFCDARAGLFTARLAEQDGEVLGFCVVKVSQGRGYIADLLALPGRIDVVRSLMGDAISLLRDAGVYGVDCLMVARHPYRKVLREYGFFDWRRSPGFSFRTPPGVDDLAFLQDRAAKVHLTLADSDLV